MAETENRAEVGLSEAIRTGLRKCRVEDGSPAPLIHEGDLFHVTHMVKAEVEPLLAARHAALHAERDAARREERMRAEDHARAWREVADLRAKVERAEALAEGQWRTNNGHLYDSTSEAYAAGRNITIDHLRAALGSDRG